MPTAAKLVAAICFALLGAALALYVPRLMTEGARPPASLPAVAAAVFALCGWFIAGPRTGRGRGEAMAAGIGTALAGTFWLVFLGASAQMLDLAFKMRYDGAMEAVVGIFTEMTKIAPMLADPVFLGALSVGGAVGGLLTDAAGRRWS